MEMIKMSKKDELFEYLEAILEQMVELQMLLENIYQEIKKGEEK